MSRACSKPMLYYGEAATGSCHQYETGTESSTWFLATCYLASTGTTVPLQYTLNSFPNSLATIGDISNFEKQLEEMREGDLTVLHQNTWPTAGRLECHFHI